MSVARIVSVGWLCIRDGRLLVVRTRGRAAFYLPGGKPEPGETLSQTLRREVAEELGMVVDAASIAEAFVVHARAHGVPRAALRMHCFRADASGVPRPAREIAELTWVGPDDRVRCAPAVRQVLDRLLG
ncbi:NUDIX hydrolase [Pseudonocardia acidicola]|uniref:NUDIX hydrolase n=1 Tax=Pseudonocardia acidicola TaxID=2724939 RepID=UPI001B7D1703